MDIVNGCLYIVNQCASTIQIQLLFANKYVHSPDVNGQEILAESMYVLVMQL